MSAQPRLSPAPSPRPVADTWYDADDMRWAVRHWAARMGVPTPVISFRPMRTRWASISKAGHLTLDAELLDLPRDLGEFVIVHELVHLLAFNHGKLFKAYLSAYLPDWENRLSQLDRYSCRQASDGRGSQV